MNRLYVAEPCADGHRQPWPTTACACRVRGPRRGRRRCRSSSARPRAGQSLARAGGAVRAASAGAAIDSRWIAPWPRTCSASRGRSLVIAGRRQPAGGARAGRRAQRRARQRRHDRRATGAPLTARPAVGPGAAARPWSRRSPPAQVDTLVITAENPVYAAPADFKLAQAAGARPQRRSTSACTRTRPARWRARSSSRRPTCWRPGATSAPLDGTVSIVQPLIHPLWGGRTEAELLRRLPRRGRKGAHALLNECCAAAGSGQGRAPAATSSPPGSAGWPRASSPKTGGAGRGRAAVDARRAGAGWAPALARCHRWRRAWSSPSPSTPRSSTAASPTTPGCRSCRTRSPS